MVISYWDMFTLGAIAGAIGMFGIIVIAAIVSNHKK